MQDVTEVENNAIEDPHETQNMVTPFQSAFTNMDAFKDRQRQAALLASTKGFLPKTFEGNMANCFVAIEYAMRMREDPFVLMNEVYFVHNKPSFSSKFIIARVNGSGRFTPIRYRFTGTQGKDDWGCVAWAYDRAELAYQKENAEKLEGTEVTIQMAKDEGWYGKAGSKWKSMPQQMLMYRAGTFFARIYASDIVMGMSVQEELEDIGAVEIQARVVEDPNVAKAMKAASKTGKKATTITTKAEITENRKSIPKAPKERQVESQTNEEVADTKGKANS